MKKLAKSIIRYDLTRVHSIRDFMGFFSTIEVVIYIQRVTCRILMRLAALIDPEGNPLLTSQ